MLAPKGLLKSAMSAAVRFKNLYRRQFRGQTEETMTR